MITIEQLDTEIQGALKRRDSLTADTLRGLKTRIKNDEIAKGRPLEEAELTALIRSEVKRRKESVAAFTQGGRPELAQKEQDEIAILSAYLPAEPGEAEIAKAVEEVLAGGTYTVKDFGAVMGQLKQKLPNADGGTLSSLLKEKLK